MIDLTMKPNNPAWEMKQFYNDIMDAANWLGGNPALGVARACGIIDSWAEQEISGANAHFWKKTIKEAAESGNWGGIRNDPVGAVQKCVSDFILSAMGLSTSFGGKKFRRAR